MYEESVDTTRLADEVIANVREIVKQETGKQAKLSAMRKLAAKLGEAAAACQRSYEKAKSSGNSAAMAAIKKQHDIIDKGLHYVSASAKKLVQRKPKKMGFDCEPNYFVDPGWDKQPEIR